MNIDDIKSIQKIASQAMDLLKKYAPQDEDEDWDEDESDSEDDFEDDDEL